MKGQKTLFSSNSDEWYTPRALFDSLDEEFHFTLDPCCTESSKLCNKYYTQETDGLAHSWDGERVFCNPPYSDIAKWVEKCYREGTKDNTIVCMLIPSRTDTRYFHNFIYQRSEIRFVSGRLKFSMGGVVLRFRL